MPSCLTLGAVIGSGRNLREAHADPLAHAEVKGMTQAARSLGTWNLADCTLIRFGAVPDVRRRVPANACRTNRVRRVGCQVGCMRFDLGHSSRPACRSCSEVIGGVRESECARLMTDFFAGKR